MDARAEVARVEAGDERGEQLTLAHGPVGLAPHDFSHQPQERASEERRSVEDDPGDIVRFCPGAHPDQANGYAGSEPLASLEDLQAHAHASCPSAFNPACNNERASPTAQAIVNSKMPSSSMPCCRSASTSSSVTVYTRRRTFSAKASSAPSNGAPASAARRSMDK